MDRIEVLWVDDEIEMLKPHFLFLEERGYNVTACSNGQDALDLIDDKTYEIILLDENMPGLNGLETLEQIKSKMTFLPVIMITKNEEESIMDDAIGAKISDYLIKPVNPNQILLSIKKNLDSKKLVNQAVTSRYQKEFREISTALMDVRSLKEWEEIYLKLVHWEVELDKIDSSGMVEILEMQKSEANSLFFKYVKKNYKNWFNKSEERPVLSHTLFKEKVLPHLKEDRPSFFILIDNKQNKLFDTLSSRCMKYNIFLSSEENHNIINSLTAHYSLDLKIDPKKYNLLPSNTYHQELVPL